jgi:hypothetical protein
MLGPISRFGASKGMVRVPNLKGLNRGQALQVLKDLGLKFSESSTKTTSNSSLADKVDVQSIQAGALVDYESEIAFDYYSYVPYVPTVTYGGCETASSSSSGRCSGQTYVLTITTSRHRPVFYDGSLAFYEACSATTDTYFTENSFSCGYVPPARSCTASCGSYSSWSSCSGGSQTRTRTCTRSNCSTYTDADSRTCCTESCGSWSSWSGGQGGQSRTRTCLRSNCTTYTETQNRCAATSSTSCGSCSGKKKSRSQSCTTTTVSSDCSISSRSFTQSC